MKRILFVDDEPKALDALRRMMGLAVSGCRSGGASSPSRASAAGRDRCGHDSLCGKSTGTRKPGASGDRGLT